MLQHRMVVGKIQLALDRRIKRRDLGAGELNAFVPPIEFEPGQHAHEIVVPEISSVFTVCRHMQTEIFLHSDGINDRRILDGLEFLGRDTGIICIKLPARS